MKDIFAFCFVLLGFTNLYAQAQDNANDTDKIFSIVQQKPQFQGDVYRWLSENVNYPKEARDSNIQGTVYVSFVIEKDGSVSNAKLLRGIRASLDKEVLRVVSAMPQWAPGMQNYNPVRVQYVLPIHFVLKEGGLSYIRANGDTVYNIVEQQPKFQGDIQEWLGDSIKYSQKGTDIKEDDTVYVSLIVEKDGWVSNVKVLNNRVPSSLDSGIVAVVSRMPKWTPGMQDGKPVSVQYNFAIRFIRKGFGNANYFPFVLNDGGKLQFPYDVSNWISEQVNYPEEAKKEKIVGTVFVSFNVELDGSVSHIKIVQGVENGAMLDKEAERIISVMPKWRTSFMVEGITAKIVFNLKSDSIAKTRKTISRAIGYDGKVYTITMMAPKFSGDLNAWLAKNIQYPEKAKDANIQGTVYVSFVIEKDGSVSGVKLLRGVNSYLDNEAIRVISLMPKWIPGTQNEKPLKEQFTLPIHFILR